jgi:Flp pilus assembly protein TadD
MQARDLLPADPAVASLLGQVAYAQGKYDWAERLLQESIAKVPGDARALYYLGMCRYQAGDTAAARERLQAALSQASPFPEAEEAKRLLAEIP